MKPNNLILAEDINTKAEQLIKLAKTEDKKVLAAIARNPNTPIDLLIELAGEHLEEIGKNIALDLILFENPNFIDDVYYQHIEDLYYQQRELYSYSNDESCWISLPDWFIKLTIFHSNSEIREVIARNHYTSEYYLEQLAKDPDEEVRYGIAANYNTPIFILELLADDESNEVRYGLARNENTPISILEQLANDRIEEVRKAAECQLIRKQRSN